MRDVKHHLQTSHFIPELYLYLDGDSRSGSTVTSFGGACSARGTLLPWGAHKERTPHPAGPCVNSDMDIRPGEFVMRTLFADFTVQAAKKIEGVMTEPPVINNILA